MLQVRILPGAQRKACPSEQGMMMTETARAHLTELIVTELRGLRAAALAAGVDLVKVDAVLGRRREAVKVAGGAVPAPSEGGAVDTGEVDGGPDPAPPAP